MLLAFGTAAFAADEDIYETADEFARAGDAVAMEQLYGEILLAKPGDIRALIGRATAYAWQGNYDAALSDYQSVLGREPRNIEALTGLGYVYAWDGNYAEAERTFQQALQLAPDNPGAKKGLGYTYLWSDRGEEALQVFSETAAVAPGDPESHVGVGQARMSLGQAQRASSAFEHALALDSEREDAALGLQAARQLPPLAELHVWGGNTSSGGDTGLRLLELASSINQQTRLWLRYDNSLSLDNPALARSSEKAETYYVGGLRQINPDWLVLVDLGMRDLPAGADQDLYKLELIRLLEGRSVKFGSQFGRHSDGFTEELFYGAYGFELGHGWRLEPTLFLSETGAMKDTEWRAVVNAEYQSADKWQLGLGAGVGDVSSDTPGVSGSVSVANARFSIPIANHHTLHFSLRYEDAPANDFTVAMLGLSLRLPRR